MEFYDSDCRILCLTQSTSIFSIGHEKVQKAIPCFQHSKLIKSDLIFFLSMNHGITDIALEWCFN